MGGLMSNYVKVSAYFDLASDCAHYQQESLLRSYALVTYP